MKNFLLLALGLIILPVLKTSKVFGQKSTQPKLVIGIVVDQMRYDYLTRFESKFSETGFKRLLNEGFHCDEHHFSYMPTYTGPGHASIFTGTTPRVHGVISNNWYDKNLKRVIYCVEDSTVVSIGVDAKKERRSPKNSIVTSLGDQIKLSTSYKGKSIGVSIKDRGAILPAGKMADAAYWFRGGTEGKFITSSYYMNELPNWVKEFNLAKKPSEYLSGNWETLLPIEDYTESNPDNNPYEDGLTEGEDPVFPYNLKRISEKEGLSLIKSTPFGNDLILDFTIAAIEGEELGKDEIMDWLTVSFSSPDYIGHAFGPRSIEVEDTYLRLDQNISEFLKYLDKNIGKGEYLVFLTADHGVAQVPQELIDNGVEVGYYNEADILSKVNKELINIYKTDSLIESFTNFQFFLNATILERYNLNLDQVSQTIMNKVIKIDGVKSAISRNSLNNNQFTDKINQSVQKGWNAKRSGDVAIVMQPGWLSNYYESNGGTSHGSPWAYDTHVPLIFYGFGVANGLTLKNTSVEDIVPTIGAIIGVQPPMGCTGSSIQEVIKD